VVRSFHEHVDRAAVRDDDRDGRSSERLDPGGHGFELRERAADDRDRCAILGERLGDPSSAPWAAPLTSASLRVSRSVTAGIDKLCVNIEHDHGHPSGRSGMMVGWLHPASSS
jgi:hypothetical protein